MQAIKFFILFIIAALLLGLGTPLIEASSGDDIINYTSYVLAFLSVMGMLVFGNLWVAGQNWKIWIKALLCIFIFLLTVSEFGLAVFIMN